jgi:Sec-independent protein translocase protein TatA
VKNYEVINDHFSRQVSSDLYNAIYDGISELKNKFPKQNKILLVFSAGKNLELSNYNSIETLNQYAKKEKVAVYSMQYMLWEHETIDVLAHESFGKFFHIQGPFPLKGAHDNNTASDSLVSFMNGAVERLYGHDYRIKYNTTFEEDGKQHYVTVSVDNDKLNVQFTAQACGIVCLFKKQPWLFGGIILVVVVLTVLLVSFSRKKKKEKEEKFQKEINDAKKKAGDIERQLDEQKKEAEEKERQRKLSEEKQQKDAAKKSEEEELLRQMKMAGVLPVLQDVNSKSEYKINRPLLLFGRKAGNDYVINDTYVSGQHFKIFFKDGFYFIEDLNSSNGTKVNGRKITNAKLNHNDIVEVGSTKLMFRF